MNTFTLTLIIDAHSASYDQTQLELGVFADRHSAMVAIENEMLKRGQIPVELHTRNNVTFIDAESTFTLDSYIITEQPVITHDRSLSMLATLVNKVTDVEQAYRAEEEEKKQQEATLWVAHDVASATLTNMKISEARKEFESKGFKVI